MKRFDGTEVNEEDAKKFRQLVSEHRWIFAKTYAAFCPHEYTLMREWRSIDDFRWLLNFVWDNGFVARYGRGESKYFIDEETGWYYFVPKSAYDFEAGKVKDCVILLNRASLMHWDLLEVSNMLGSEYIWERKRARPIDRFGGNQIKKEGQN